MIPPDDPKRSLADARPNEDESLPHLGIVGDTYTILLSGKDTNGQYCLIDMYVPPGGGPGPHRHDFEESFTFLRARLRQPFAERNQLCEKAKPSTFRQTRRTSFKTKATNPRACSASVRLPVRKNFLWKSAFRWRAERPLLQNSTKRRRRLF